MVVSDSASATGASLIGVTANVNVVLSESVPVPSSVTVTVISAVPFQFSVGINVSSVSLVIFAVTFVSAEETVYIKLSPSTSAADKITSNELSSSIV